MYVYEAICATERGPLGVSGLDMIHCTKALIDDPTASAFQFWQLRSNDEFRLQLCSGGCVLKTPHIVSRVIGKPGLHAPSPKGHAQASQWQPWVVSQRHERSKHFRVARNASCAIGARQQKDPSRRVS
jgi:hypothetical protein